MRNICKWIVPMIYLMTSVQFLLFLLLMEIIHTYAEFTRNHHFYHSQNSV